VIVAVKVTDPPTATDEAVVANETDGITERPLAPGGEITEEVTGTSSGAEVTATEAPFTVPVTTTS
jgi:hypothetical protein